MPETKQRITELEIMLMQQESTLESLSNVLYQQQRTIQMLEQRLEKLDKRISRLNTSAVTDEANETPPPHY